MGRAAVPVPWESFGELKGFAHRRVSGPAENPRPRGLFGNWNVRHLNRQVLPGDRPPNKLSETPRCHPQIGPTRARGTEGSLTWRLHKSTVGTKRGGARPARPRIVSVNGLRGEANELMDELARRALVETSWNDALFSTIV